MTKTYCDKCNEEALDKDFKFEGRMQQIKQSLVSGETKPELIEKMINLCKKCYEKNLNL